MVVLVGRKHPESAQESIHLQDKAQLNLLWDLPKILQVVAMNYGVASLRTVIVEDPLISKILSPLRGQIELVPNGQA